MEIDASFRVPVVETSQTGEARRRAIPLCRLLDLSEEDTGRVSLIITELATNLVTHARGGELVIRGLTSGGRRGVEVLSIDKGPGMATVSTYLADGFSTAGTFGYGLGTVVRASSQFDIHSELETGTIIMSRYWTAGSCAETPATVLEVGCVCLPKMDGEPCGDVWTVDQTAAGATIFVCDGIGHGYGAAAVSAAAKEIFERNRRKPPKEIVEALHAGLGNTRGAAVAVLQLNRERAQVRFSGLGNVSARIVGTNGEKSCVSHNGTAGRQASRIQEFVYPWDPESLLVMHSDGIGSRWRLCDRRQLLRRHPSVIAAALFRDFSRGTDDSTVLVAGQRSGNSPTGE